nr:metallophosphoesterase [Candidatus Njordarchaeum guaymaensis]
MVKVGAVGDIHSPKFLEDFRTALKSADCSKLDLFLFAGDLVLKGKVSNIEEVLDTLEENKIKCPIISCFGNEEYSNIRAEITMKAENRIKFLDDESTTIKIRDVNVGIVGSQGSLESPTSWQSRNIPNVEKIYAERIDKIAKILGNLQTDIRILLTHYPPTYKVLKGERKWFYPHVGCNRCEKVISSDRIDAVICAHSHLGIPFALVNNVPVYNVSLPATRKISVIEVSKTGSLDQYMVP